MVQVWYPAVNAEGSRRAPYKPPALAALAAGNLRRTTGSNLPNEAFGFATHSHQRVAAKPGKWPLILFSPAAGVSAADYTGLSEDLASRGYVVVGLDHTFDAAVEFPDGRVERRPAAADPERLLTQLMQLRLGDVRFVLDTFTSIAKRTAVSAVRTSLPPQFDHVIDPERIGMFGHSFGSPATAQSMLEDRRIDAGAALDGSLSPRRPTEGRTLWGVDKTELDRPFLLMGTVKHRKVVDKDYWPAFWERLRGDRLWLVIEGAGHYDFNDTGIFAEQIDLSKMFNEELMLGPIDGVRALTIVRVYLGAWFDRTLIGRTDPLWDGPSSRYPEVQFER